MDKLFGTNGVRGIFGKDFNLEFINDLVISIANHFENGKILVAFDGRHSSRTIEKIVSAALNYSGLDCHLAGLVPTPCLEFATKNFGYDGGIMITASHNPPEYNGIKIVSSDGVEISRDDEKKIENIYFNQNWKKPSRFGITKNENRAITSYVNAIKDHVNVSKICSRQLKVALDLGNGAQALTAIRLCQELECEIFTINEKIDGNFPGRGSEPTPQNLSELSILVKNNHADIGIAFDGDGDRSIICDGDGKILTGDSSAILLCSYLLEKNLNSIVVTCLNSATTIEKIALQTNSQVIRTKVGSVEVSRKMVSENALIGFEENGGFMYGNHNQVRDGAMTLALVLDLLTNSGKSIAENIRSLPLSYTTKDKISCSNDDANKIISQLLDDFPNSNTSDGIKITLDSQNWIMIRPSGTEPIIRIYGESNNQKNLEVLMSEYINKIKLILAR
jgi:phosphomannomutase/phosphoglucomutase